MVASSASSRSCTSPGRCRVRSRYAVERGVAPRPQMAVGLERLGGEHRRTAVAGEAAATRDARGQQQVELGHVHLADAEVGDRVEPARVGQRAGVGEEPVDLAPLAGAAGGDAGLVHDLAARLRRICSPSARWPSPLARSRWRESSGTSRRIASSTSTTGAWSRSACRTALASTAGRSCSRAKPSIRAAAVEE